MQLPPCEPPLHEAPNILNDIEVRSLGRPRQLLDAQLLQQFPHPPWRNRALLSATQQLTSVLYNILHPLREEKKTILNAMNKFN